VRTIFYTAGSHGNFLNYLFDCYHKQKVLPLQFKLNGNSHLRDTRENINCSFDICNSKFYPKFVDSNTKVDNYAIVWQDFDWFFYTMTNSLDRGAKLNESGIALLERNLIDYETQYGVPVFITNFLKDWLNFDCKLRGNPPKSVLRNYFLASFYNYFDHTLWIRNNELKNFLSTKISLPDILDYSRLSAILENIFHYNLDFKPIHDEFLKRNIALQQIQMVNKVLQKIKNNIDESIQGLNVISEAYILFCLEMESFDIPFNLGNNFFKTTKDIVEYIKYFPPYMKRPNNLFYKNPNDYQRKKRSRT